MPHQSILYIFFTVVPIFIAGCGGNESGSTSSSNSNSVENDSELANARDLILGKWKINPEATKKGWGDQREKLERVYVDELTMELEFVSKHELIISKNGKSHEIYWKEKSSTESKIVAQVSETKDSDRKLEWTFTFSKKNRVTFQSSEVQNQDNLILDRVENDSHDTGRNKNQAAASNKTKKENKGNAVKIKTVPVSGKLIIGKKPAADIHLTLTPTNPESGLHDALGNTGRDGKFVLVTGQLGISGAMPGKYRLVLRNLEEDSSVDVKVPEKYQTKTTSDIEIEITDKTDSLVIEID